VNNEDRIIEIELVEGPVQTKEWEAAPPGGAECLFRGITRPEHHPEHGDLMALKYEAQRTMAVDELHKLVNEAIERWKPLAVRLHHSTGIVPVGEASVVIQVVTPHRMEAFLACQWLIDTLKSRVPIWKQESWEDGQTWPEGTPLKSEAELTS
tara:strand:- start:194 stop:652 length:459 start_codon:yes stop_codon:yes gene_type:complete